MTRTSWPRAARRVANWYARLSDPPTRAYARLVKRSFMRVARGASRVPLRSGGGLAQADELRPHAFAGTNVGRVEVLGGRRWTDRLAEQRHARLGERTTALPVIARLACRDDVLPDVLAPTMTRDHMVECEVVAAPPAVLAGVVVTHEDFFPCHLHDRTRALHVVGEPDHRGGGKAEPLARHKVSVLLDDARLFLGKEDHRSAHVADVERLKVKVEYEHIRVDDAHIVILGSARYDRGSAGLSADA